MYYIFCDSYIQRAEILFNLIYSIQWIKCNNNNNKHDTRCWYYSDSHIARFNQTIDSVYYEKKTMAISQTRENLSEVRKLINYLKSKPDIPWENINTKHWHTNGVSYHHHVKLCKLCNLWLFNAEKMTN